MDPAKPIEILEWLALQCDTRSRLLSAQPDARRVRADTSPNERGISIHYDRVTHAVVDRRTRRSGTVLQGATVSNPSEYLLSNADSELVVTPVEARGTGVGAGS
jgi:hypothetical protein